MKFYFSFLLITFLLFPFLSTYGQVSSQEYEGLVAFYKATGGDNWTDKSNWDITQNPSENTVNDSWKGIGIKDGHVISIFLDDNNLVGSIPDEIEKLSYLSFEFYLSDNKINTVSPKIGMLNKLESLNLNGNEIEKLPKEIQNLSSLVSISLSSNKMTEIPSFIFEMTNLTDLSFAKNELAILPKEIAKLENLIGLYLYNNNLETLPTEIAQLSKLEDLDISNNKLKEFSTELFLLENLLSLSVSRNQITELPNKIGNLTKLETLEIDDNKMSKLPKEIGLLTNLYILDIGRNQITELPNEIGNLTKLEIFIIDKNKINKLPQTLENLVLLESFYFSRNKLDQIPNYISLLPKLNTVFCSYNSFNFGDLEKIKKNPAIDIASSSYAPQKPYKVSQSLIKVKTEKTIKLTAPTKGTKNTYQWFRADSYKITEKGYTTIQHFEKIENATTSTLVLSSITKDTTAFYYCEVKNENFPDLILKSEPIRVEVIN